MHWDGGSLFHALGRGEYLQPLHCQYTLRAVKQGVGERSATSPSSVHNSTHPPTPAHTCPHLPTLPLTSRLSSREELSWVWSIVELSACGIEGRRVQGRGVRECFRISVTMGCVTGQEEAASSDRTRGTLTPNKCRKSEHSLMIHPPPPSSMAPPAPLPLTRPLSSCSPCLTPAATPRCSSATAPSAAPTPRSRSCARSIIRIQIRIHSETGPLHTAVLVQVICSLPPQASRPPAPRPPVCPPPAPRPASRPPPAAR